MTILKATNISVEIHEQLLFKPVSISLAPGECHQLVGDNGAGKSTCLRAIAGLTQHTGMIKAVQCSFMGHESGLYDQMRVDEILNWWQEINNCKIVNNEIPNIIIEQLSAGQKQKLAWLRLLSEKNKLWLLDEPLTNLDKTAQAQVVAKIKAHLQEGGAAIIISHLADIWSGIITRQHRIVKNVDMV